MLFRSQQFYILANEPLIIGWNSKSQFTEFKGNDYDSNYQLALNVRILRPKDLDIPLDVVITVDDVWKNHKYGYHDLATIPIKKKVNLLLPESIRDVLANYCSPKGIGSQ